MKQRRLDLILDAAFRHMQMLPDIKRRGLDTAFAEDTPQAAPDEEPFFPREGTPFFPTEEPPF